MGSRHEFTSLVTSPGDTWLLWSGLRWECEFENVLMSRQIAHGVPHHLKAAGGPRFPRSHGLRVTGAHDYYSLLSPVSLALIGFWLTASEPALITNKTNDFGEMCGVFFSFFCQNSVLSLSALWQLILLIEPSDHCQSAVYICAMF